MPSHVKYFLLLSAILELLVGIYFFLRPVAALAGAFAGIESSPAAEMAIRLAGAALASLGLMALMARNQTSAASLRPVLAALLCYNVLAVIHLGSLGLVSGIPSAVPPAIMHLVLSVASIFYITRKD